MSASASGCPRSNVLGDCEGVGEIRLEGSPEATQGRLRYERYGEHAVTE